MSAIFNKLKVEKSEGMTGMGADQGALRDKLEASGSPSFDPEKGDDPDTKDELG